jgi:predicted metal-binding membrane protein
LRTFTKGDTAVDAGIDGDITWFYLERRPSMTTANASPFSRERKLILALLLILAAASWTLLIWQSTAMNSQAMGMGLTMGMSVVLFIAIWVVMMIAMMFPTAAPMILMFTSVYAGKKSQNQAFVPTWVFVSAYLLIWTLFGLVAYPLAIGAERLAGQSMWLMTNAPRISGALLVVAGLYQLSPLKRICLSKCRTPLQFILGSWRDGYGGAFRMGFLHGVYCLGCCWFLFVLLFPLGIMNIAVMALLTALIYAEKAFSLGRQISQIAGVALIVYGMIVIVVPAALPAVME